LAGDTSRPRTQEAEEPREKKIEGNSKIRWIIPPASTQGELAAVLGDDLLDRLPVIDVEALPSRNFEFS